jgi:hypothetical protein
LGADLQSWGLLQFLYWCSCFASGTQLVAGEIILGIGTVSTNTNARVCHVCIGCF